MSDDAVTMTHAGPLFRANHRHRQRAGRAPGVPAGALPRTLETWQQTDCA